MKPCILQQDDCSPDSLEYFEKGFKIISGMPIKEFKQKAFKAVLEKSSVVIWRHKKLELSISSDDPFYTLRKT